MSTETARREDVMSIGQICALTYRQLQQMAKKLKVPSNIKKTYLQEVLYHHLHKNHIVVANLIAQAQKERDVKRKRESGRIKKSTSSRSFIYPAQFPGLKAFEGIQLGRDMSVRIIPPSEGKRRSRKQQFARNTPAVVRKVVRASSDRILRNRIYPIYSKLSEKKNKSRSESSEDIVTSTADDSKENILEPYANSVAYESTIDEFTQTPIDEPLDFSIKKQASPNVENVQTNEIEQSSPNEYSNADSTTTYRYLSNVSPIIRTYDRERQDYDRTYNGYDDRERQHYDRACNGYATSETESVDFEKRQSYECVNEYVEKSVETGEQYSESVEMENVVRKRDDYAESNVYCTDYTCELYRDSLPPMAEAFPKYCRSMQSYAPLYVCVDHEEVIPPQSEIDSALANSHISSLSTGQSTETMAVNSVIQETYPNGQAVSELDSIVSSLSYEMTSSVNSIPAPVVWQDVLAIMSQTQEQVTECLNGVQCVYCNWNGQSYELETHIRKTHTEKIYTYEASVEIKHSVSLGYLLEHGKQYTIIEWLHQLMVCVVSYEEPEWLLATVALLSPQEKSPPVQASLTVHNKVTSVPQTWNGAVLFSNLVSADPTTRLRVPLSKLGLLPNMADAVIWNGQLRTTDVKSVCGSSTFHHLIIDLYVRLSC